MEYDWTEDTGSGILSIIRYERRVRQPFWNTAYNFFEFISFYMGILVE